MHCMQLGQCMLDYELRIHPAKPMPSSSGCTLLLPSFLAAVHAGACGIQEGQGVQPCEC